MTDVCVAGEKSTHKGVTLFSRCLTRCLSFFYAKDFYRSRIGDRLLFGVGPMP